MEKPRTDRQNRSLHVYFQLLADELNSAGYDMKKTLKHDVDIPWSGELIKDYIWRPIQRAQVQKDSTTELTTDEVNKIYLTLTRHLAERFGIDVSFPSDEPELYA